MAALNSSSAPQQYCLKWNSFTSNMSEMFQDMLMHESLVDCTLACDGLSIKAHKLILSACSPYFQQLFISNPCKHPIVILNNIKFNDLKAIIDFIYSGEVNIPMDQLPSLLAAAETLKIKGLSDFNERQNANDHPQPPQQAQRAAAVAAAAAAANLSAQHLNPLMHSTPLSKVLTMQNPATNHLAANLAIPYNSYFQKGLKRKRARADIPPSSLRNLSAITRSAPMNMAKLNKQMISNLVKAVPAADKARLEAASNAAARLFESHLAKEVAKNNGTISAGGSSEDEEDVKETSVLESNNNQTIANKNGMFDGEEEFEPTKLLEQSMSTPENANVDYEGEDGEEEGNETNGNEDGFSSNNSNQDVSLMSTGSDPTAVQVNKTIEEYEQLLAEIQSKNLTTCPICSKEFIKKSKLIRHYHTHFSDFRPKFSCVFCGKLFTTQDWCKRHAMNCQLKHYHSLTTPNLNEMYDMEKERDI